MLPVQAGAPGATGDPVGRGVVKTAHVVRTPRAAIARSHWEWIITSQWWTLELPAVEFTVL